MPDVPRLDVLDLAPGAADLPGVRPAVGEWPPRGGGMTRRPVPQLAALLAFYRPLDVPNTSLAGEDSAEPAPVVPETPETRPCGGPGATNPRPRGIEDGRP